MSRRVSSSPRWDPCTSRPLPRFVVVIVVIVVIVFVLTHPSQVPEEEAAAERISNNTVSHSGGNFTRRFNNEIGIEMWS